MIFLLKMLVLAIVEGLTEFLPVSSTGHMIMAGFVMGLEEGNTFVNFYEVFIQAGAILAIVVLFRKKIAALLKSFFKLEKRGWRFFSILLVAALPAAILGVILDDYIDQNLFSVKTLAIGLLLGALLLIFAERYFKKEKGIEDVEKISYGQALTIGVFQCLSLWPGMSRSSSTITGAWFAGLNTAAGVEFSFLLAIPMLLGAAGFKSLKFAMGGGFSQVEKIELLSLALGFVVAFLVALAVVKVFINFLTKRPLKYLGYYRIALAAVFFLLIVMGKI